MTLIFDAPFGINGIPGGGSIDESKIIVKSTTIPTASEDNLGFVYQYVGETNSTYTHGYIYECKSSVSTTAIVNFEPHKIAFDEGSLVSFFEEAGDTSHEVVSGRFKYLEAGDIWNINGLDANGNTVFSDYQVYTQDLVDAGFVIIVPMTDIADNEEIAYELVYRNTTSYAWERIDVQPGATRGRFLALWNCATGLAESNPPSSPYPYGAGDYFIVGTVSTTNYKPSGSSYVIGTASTTVETGDVAVNDTYYYDGTNWNLQKNAATTVDQTYDPTSENAQSGVAVAQALSTVSVSVDNVTVTKNVSNQLQASAVMNARTGTNALSIWQGTEQQWTNGVGTDWYNWKGPESANVSSGGFGANSPYTKIIYGNNVYIAIGPSNGTYQYSTDGLNWESKSFPVAKSWSCSVYGDKFVLISGDTCIYSTDGLNWTTSTMPITDKIWIDVGYGNGVYLAVYDGNGGYTDSAAYATDLDSWSTVSLPASVAWQRIAYGANKFVIVAGAAYVDTNTMAYSSDGTNWDTSTMSASGQWKRITYGAEGFMAAGNQTYGGNIAAFSADGVTWTSITNPGIDMANLAYGSGYYVGVSLNKFYYTNDNGTTWSNITPTNEGLSYIIFDGEKFLSGVYNTNFSYGNILTLLTLKCYTNTLSPTTSSTVYSEPNTASALTITSVGTGTITLSDNNTYTYNQTGDQITYQTIGEAHPTWLCNINGVGVKVGNTLVADYTTLDNVPTQGSANGITSGAVYTVLGDLETALHNINSGS